MAWIPAEELARLKREVDLVALVERSGVELAKKGGDLVGLCPFHDDREPSLVVTPAKNLWHCLGACQAGGSVIDWVMRLEGVSFRHAVELLRRDYAPRPDALSSVPVEQSASIKLDPIAAPEDGDRELLERVVTHYHATLLESPEALEYLEQRGIASPEAIERFRLGYANRTLGYRLPPKKVKAGAEIRGRLQELGVLRTSGHEHFNGSVVIPIFDRPPEEGGRVVEMYGRKIRDDLRKGTPAHLYLPGPHRGVWNLSGLASSKEVILTESLIDALTFWCAGFENVTAAYGTKGFTQEHREALQAYGIERVLVAFDRDAAGDAAAARLAEDLAGDGIECYRIQFPRGMDANEYAVKVQPAKKALGLLIHNAVWLGKGLGSAEQPAAKKEKPADPPEEPPSLAASEPPASPLPAAPRLEIPAEVREQEVVIPLDDRRYRVRGLERNRSYDTLKVNLLAARGDAFHVDTLDLYQARQRKAFLQQVAAELQVKEDLVKRDLGRVLLKLEELQEAQLREALEPKGETKELSEAERAEALELLRTPDLAGRILADLDRAGLVGEETNKLVGYLAAVSRKLAHPLAVVIQSSSAAGKSSLMEAVLSLVPGEDRVQYSAMTGQSLFYMGETDLAHKVLAIVEEEGAERASYALKLLQSEGELTIASTGKDPKSGKLVTHEYRVEGPVAIFLTTTAIDVDEELLNRSIVLTVDEERDQTRAIHRLQRERRTLAGLLAGAERADVLRTHANAQRLLEPLAVVNPYAPELTFLDTRTRTRRDHEKYLTLIDAIALLSQHQREVRSIERGGRELRYVEVELSDIELANRLAHEVLGRSLDELPPQTRRFLERLDAQVSAWCEAEGVERSDLRFRARDVREALGLGATQVKVHLRRLVELEYVIVHATGHGVGTAYELVVDLGKRGEGGDGDGGRPFLPGLIDVDKLRERCGYDADRSGTRGGRSGSEASPSGAGRGEVGPRPEGGRSWKRAAKERKPRNLRASELERPRNSTSGGSRAASGRSVVEGGW